MDSRHDLLPFFLAEADAALASMGASLDVLRARPADTAASDRLFQGAHTLGGLAAVAGCQAVADFTRLVEGAIKRLGASPREDGVEITELLDSSLRTLRQLVTLTSEGSDDVPSEVTGLVERLGRVCAAAREEARLILVVDDSRTVLRFVERALSRAGFRVETATTEGGAAAFLSRERPALILVDLSIASGDEGSLLARLGAGAGAEVPLVLFSNRSEEELAEIQRRVGAAGFLRKTGEAAALVAAVRGWLDGRPCAPEGR